MNEVEFNLYSFYERNRNTELRLTAAGFQNLLHSRGRKVYSRIGEKSRLCVSYAEGELTLAAVGKKDLSSRVFGFRVGAAIPETFQVLSCEKFFHHFEAHEVQVSAYVSTYKDELCAVIFDYIGEANLPLLFSITRHHFQVDLLFVPEAVIGKLDERCFLALSCPAGLPFLA